MAEAVKEKIIVRPAVGIIGDSGTGKSSMFGTLPAVRTVILNTETKELPIENFSEFNNIMIDAFKKLDKTLDALKKPEMVEKYDYVVLDSFTSMAEMIDKYANHVFSGYEVWNQYNMMISDVVKKIKVLPQQVFIVAIPEQKAEQFGEVKAYARVKGNELKFGFLEKELAIVMFTNPAYAEEDIPEKEIEEGEMISVHMDYKPNKRNSAKAPRGLFTKKPINDALAIAKAIDTFYGN